MSERQQRARRQRSQRAQAQTQVAQRAAGVTQPSLLMAASRQEERFQAFHRQHTEVYRAFERRALALAQRGYRRWGAAAIFEVLRYESAISGQPDDAYKLNNSFRAYYARMFLARHPELDGFFETRQQRSA